VTILGTRAEYTNTNIFILHKLIIFFLEYFCNVKYKPYEILLTKEEMKIFGKKEYSGDFPDLFVKDDGREWVCFSEEEFKNFKRTKIIEHNIND